MFAHESIVIKHFETICSVDQGTAINPKVEAALRIVKNAMAARENGNATFSFCDTTELGLLNGAQINLGLYGPDLHLLQTYDLNSYSFSCEGAEEAIDYLDDMFKENFWYAQQQLEVQKPKKRTRRSRKTA